MKCFLRAATLALLLTACETLQKLQDMAPGSEASRKRNSEKETEVAKADQTPKPEPDAKEAEAAETEREAKVTLKFLINGHPDLKDWSASDMEDELTRSGSTTGSYKAKATLQTLPFIEKKIREKEERNMTPEAKIKAEIKESQEALAKDAACFLVYVQGSTLASAQTENWVAKLRVKGEMFDLKFNSPNGIPNHSRNDYWYNYDHACAKSKPSLQEGFTLFLIPQISKDDPIELVWP